jgi:hypothetical protein
MASSEGIAGKMSDLLFKSKAVWVTAVATAMIWITDHLPQKIRRKILSSEYCGKDLDDRLTVKIFAGWSMIKAVHRMLTINMRPQLQIGQHVGNLKVVRLGSQEPVSVANLCASSGRPLILNFGSCT